MTEFSPKQTFQQLHPQAVKDLQLAREQSWLKIAFSYSISQMAFNGSTAEEIKGGKQLISTFQNLWEGAVEMPRLPIKTLDTFERPIEQVVKEGEERAKSEL